MKQIWMIAVVAMVLMTGCTAARDGAKITLNYGPETKVKTVEDQGFWGPTIKTVYTYECVPEEGITQVNVQDGETFTCNGRYVALQPQTATQAGIGTSVVTPIVTTAEGGAAMYFGMRDFGSHIPPSKTTNNNDTSSNGGNSNSLSSSRNENINQNFNSAAASASSSKNDYTFNKGKHRR